MKIVKYKYMLTDLFIVRLSQIASQHIKQQI